MSAAPDFAELARYLEKELTQQRAAEIDAQLKRSESLRADLERVKALVNDLSAPDPDLERIDLLPSLHVALETPTSARSPRWRWALGGALTSAAILCAVAASPLFRSDSFRVKGVTANALDGWAGAEVYVVEPGHRAAPLGKSVRADQRLAFAYRNAIGSPFTHLAIFAVDGSGRVYWYYPAWERPDENPVLLSISRSTGAVELPDAVRHAFQPGPLHLHALFTGSALHVSEVEATLRSTRPGSPIELPGSVDQRLDTRVEP
jgi:hypothetical protein